MMMNKIVDTLYTELALKKINALCDRIADLSEYFLGKSYIANPQGEGMEAEFDTAPLYRFDGFDCVTYVNNILALALSHDLKSFQKNLLRVNYYDAKAKYENRFHFMSVDWNIQNQKNKIVYDVTGDVVDEKSHRIAEMAEGEIDKPHWFLKKSEYETDRARKKLLQKYAEIFTKEIARIPYLPLTKLFDSEKKPREFIFNQIPHASVIEIVRPNWNVKDKIGTNLHVSHVGFGIRKSPPFEKGGSGGIFFRHASSENQCVTEILLSDYLKNCLESPTIQGVNVQMIGNSRELRI